jgi:ATP-binding cassette subfamily B protein RaxB
VGSIVDGILALTTLVLMFYYSVTLATVVTGAFVLYVIYKVVRYRYLRLQSLGLLHAKAKENTNFLENIRGARAIKIFGRENERQSIWQNLYAATVNIGFRVNRINIFFAAANDLLFGMEEILVIYLAARMIFGGGFTVGMMFAFLSYRDLFVSKSLNVVQTIIDFKMLDIHLGRLADIGFTPKERGLDAPLIGREVVGALVLDKVSFRYADAEPLIFEDLTFSAEPGESVGITGPSGCGKTTMMKIMLGLLPPASGEVLVDGRPLHVVGLPTFRRAVSAVMQDDQMMSGSIADNIAFFDPELDMEWAHECARIAAIDDDIMRMPMGYNTLTGDMGTVLSGGQKQRILLARALYTRPKILILDEGTAHLDLYTEKVVSDAIARLNMTRIIIAHRPQTIALANRIVHLEGGRLTAVRTGVKAITSGESTNN